MTRHLLRNAALRRMKSSRGVSLIEALLALVVMSLGMLAVVGVQATLRSNGDLSRQRAEAVRLAQEGIETWRTFTSVTPVAGQVDYSDIASDLLLGEDVTPALANATYMRTRTVAPDPPNGSPPLRTLSSTVRWVDRAGEAQTVQLFTSIARIAPALAASLSVPANGAPARQPLGRHAAIPRGAITQSDGTSIFTPPLTAGLLTTTLIFNNLTGLITCIQEGVATCTPAYVGQLVTGYVGVPPASTGFTLRIDYVSVGTASNTIADLDPPRTAAYNRTEQCFVAAPALIDGATVTEYYCVVRLDASNAVPKPWSGQLVFDPGAAFAVTTAAVAGPTTQLRACRYDGVNASYVDITRSLSDQNLLLQFADAVCPAGTNNHQPGA